MIGRRDFFFSWTLYFFPYSRLFSYLLRLFLYFILAVYMRECLGKHSSMSSPFPIAILNGTFVFREAKYSKPWPKIRRSKSIHITYRYTVNFVSWFIHCFREYGNSEWPLTPAIAWPLGLLALMPTLLLYIFALCCLPSSSRSLP